MIRCVIAGRRARRCPPRETILRRPRRREKSTPLADGSKATITAIFRSPRYSIPTPIHGAGRPTITAAEVGDRVYVFGGEGADGTFRENEAYDPARDAWQSMAPMPTARHGLGSAVAEGRIYVISGGPAPGGSFSDLNEVFSPPSSR